MTTYNMVNDSSKDSSTHMKLTEIKKELLKAVKYEDNVTVAVNIYDVDEGEQTYDVEVTYYIDGKYVDCFVSDVFYENEEAKAVKRGKTVLKSVTNWFAGYDEIEVKSDVKVYTN